MHSVNLKQMFVLVLVKTHAFRDTPSTEMRSIITVHTFAC